jgi:hypothetical protein
MTWHWSHQCSKPAHEVTVLSGDPQRGTSPLGCVERLAKLTRSHINSCSKRWRWWELRLLERRPMRLPGRGAVRRSVRGHHRRVDRRGADVRRLHGDGSGTAGATEDDRGVRSPKCRTRNDPPARAGRSPAGGGSPAAPTTVHLHFSFLQGRRSQSWEDGTFGLTRADLRLLLLARLHVPGAPLDVFPRPLPHRGLVAVRRF